MQEELTRVQRPLLTVEMIVELQIVNLHATHQIQLHSLMDRPGIEHLWLSSYKENPCGDLKRFQKLYFKSTSPNSWLCPSPQYMRQPSENISQNVSEADRLLRVSGSTSDT